MFSWSGWMKLFMDGNWIRYCSTHDYDLCWKYVEREKPVPFTTNGEPTEPPFYSMVVLPYGEMPVGNMKRRRRRM